MRGPFPTLLPALLLSACPAAPPKDDSAPVAEDTCEPAALPAISEAISTGASVYDPEGACWRSGEVELEASLWSSYAPSDTGEVECNDVELMFGRVDCSCVYLSSQCGDVGAALAADPAVDRGEAATERCVTLREDAPDCG